MARSSKVRITTLARLMDEAKHLPSYRAIWEKALKLISEKENWCQGYVARSKTGRRVDAHSPKAVAWCAMGACMKAGGKAYHHGVGAASLLDAYSHRIEGFYLDELNDTKGEDTHARVLALFRRAIREA
jgi:hypothetical protein